MTFYRAIELPSDEPVQYVGVYVLKWGKVDEPTVGFAESDLPEKLEALYDAVDDYIYSPGDNAYPDDHCNPEFLADLRAAFLAVTDAPETDFDGLMEPDVDTPFDGFP